MEEYVRRILRERFSVVSGEREEFGRRVVELFAGLGPVAMPERDEYPRQVNFDR